MVDERVRTCPECSQQLRFPDNIGGMVMCCPVCSHKFHTGFSLKMSQKSAGDTGKRPRSSSDEPAKRNPRKRRPGGFNVVV